MPLKVAGAYLPAKDASDEHKDFIKAFQPFAEKSALSSKLRQHAFASCDTNGSRKCSLAEIDSFIKATLQKEHTPERSAEIYTLFKPSYIRAFNSSKVVAKTEDPEDNKFVNFSEFRILNAYLCVYAGMLDAFAVVDGGGEGVDKDDDRRIEKAEWLKAYHKFHSSPFVALYQLGSDEDARSAFSRMDADGKGMVLLLEFCAYVVSVEKANHTLLGKLLDGQALKAKNFAKAS